MSVSVHRSTPDLVRAPLLVGAAGASAAALLHLRDPHAADAYGYCPFLWLTGHPCPGCGGLRAVNDLTNGDLVGAVSSNLLAVVFVATLAVVWAAWVVRRARGVDAPMITLGDRTLVLVLLVALAFGVARNTACGAWLAP